MKKLSLLLAVILSLTIVSCSHSGVKEETRSDNLSDLPSWVINPEVENGIGGVGIASPSKGDFKFKIAKAEMDGRANIATHIQTEISRVTKEALREAKVNDVDDVEEVFTQATKEVIKNMPLSGASRVAMYQGKDGTFYVHMVLKNKDFNSYFQSSQKVFEARLKAANISRDNINKSQVAVKELFDELEKERGNDAK